MERQTRIAIAASLVWMAVATFLILGTHGPGLAKAEPPVEEGVEAPATEWKALPAHGVDVVRTVTGVEVQC